MLEVQSERLSLHDIYVQALGDAPLSMEDETGGMPVALSVAAWEFRRFYKLRDQLLSLVLGLVGGALGVAVQWFVGYASTPVTVAVLHADRLPASSSRPARR